MSIPVPVANDPVIASWASDIANRLNQMIPLVATAGQTTSSTSWSDIAGLTFPVEAGKSYIIRAWGLYTVTATGNGFVVGYKRPGGSSGTVSSYLRAYGNGGATTALIERVSSADDGGTGIATIDGTASRQWDIDVLHVADVTGTFALRWKRPGATNSNITMVVAGGFVINTM